MIDEVDPDFVADGRPIPTVSEYFAIEETIAPVVLETIATWIQARTGQPKPKLPVNLAPKHGPCAGSRCMSEPRPVAALRHMGSGLPPERREGRPLAAPLATSRPDRSSLEIQLR